MKTVIHQLQTMEKPLDGMSYVIQCSDSSVVVVDGGLDKGDAEKLIHFLKKITGHQTPTVDAWIITHCHMDHTFCFIDYAERLTDSLNVKKLIYSFMPDWFYLNAEPACVPEKKRFEAAADRIPGLERVTPHTGDVYVYGDTEIEMLYTAEDTPIVNEGRGMTVNDSSLVFRVRAEGQTVMFLGDIEKGGNGVMMKRYGRALKSDVCQVAHHGFVSSTAEFYDLVDPEILLWPISMRNLKVYCPKIEVDRHLVKEMSVKDVYLAANGDVSLEMPIKVREEPYLPKIFDRELRDLVPDFKIPEAPRTPSLYPDDPVWNASPLMEANCDWWREPGPDGDTAYFRLLWDRETLYINARLNKIVVSDPGSQSSINCDCVRVYLTERPVRDTLTLWSDFTPDPGFLENVKFFPEAKKIGEKELFNTLPERCESRSFVDEKGFSVCAALKFAGKHSAGDIIGFNVEFNGVRAPGTRRAYSLNYVPETDALPCHVAPSSLAFAELA